MEQIRASIRDIQDYPKPGITFRDITPLLQNGELFQRAVKLMLHQVREVEVDQVVAIESRGFIFGAPIAIELGCGLVIVRKPDKLPYKTESLQYALEYGSDKLEMHVDAVNKGDRVLVVDDLLATGGTALATARLVEKLGAQVAGLLFLSELGGLGGREKLDGYGVHSVIKY